MKSDLLAFFGIEGCEVVTRRHPCHHPRTGRSGPDLYQRVGKRRDAWKTRRISMVSRLTR